MNNGIAIITGGRYLIAQPEGKAIGSFTPPPCLQDIDWESVKPSHKWQLEEFYKHWQIIAHWLVYERTGAVDIKQKPFTIPEVLDKRPLAEIYSTQLDLCKAVWELVDIQHLYLTPYDWWKKCIVELQNAQKDSIFSSGGIERTTPLKGELEDGVRKFVKSLKQQEQIPFKQSKKNQHLFKLYEQALQNKSKSKKIRTVWNEYLKRYTSYAKYLKTNKDLKTIVHLSGRIYFQDKQSMKAVQY